jgi:RNA polymerase-binding transcription factor DksA
MATFKGLVSTVKNILNMAKGKDKKKKSNVKAKPISKPKPAAKKAKSKPVAKKVSKPVAKKAVAKKVAKPAPKKKVAAKPVKKVLKKVAPKAKPIAKKIVKPAKPAPKKIVQKAVAKPVTHKPVAAKPAPVKSKPVVQAKAPLKKSKPVPTNDNLHRYSDDELKEFKTLIDKKMNAAREELAYLKDALDNHTDSQAGNKAWNMEEGTDTSEMETLMNQISRQHTYISNLELALVRIENKTYGICRATGQLIPKERLRVVPHATLCLEAKMSRKKDDSQGSEQPATAAPPSDFAENFED